MSKLYRIASWNETFERAESRKLKQLQWIALPVDFSGTGYQQLLEDFGEDAVSAYGAWCALCAFAATCRTRGTLGNSRGQPLKLSHIARVTGFPEPIFGRLISWALRREVGWLEIVASGNATSEPTERTDEQSATAVPENSIHASPDMPPALANSPPTLPELHGVIPRLQDRTEPDKTGPDITRPNPSVDRSDIERIWRTAKFEFKSEVMEMANRFSRLRYRLDRDLIWRACWIGVHFDPGTLHDCLERLRIHGAVTKPKNYLASAMVKLCERNGAQWDVLKHLVPPTPPPPAPQEGSELQS